MFQYQHSELWDELIVEVWFTRKSHNGMCVCLYMSMWMSAHSTVVAKWLTVSQNYPGLSEVQTPCWVWRPLTKETRQACQTREISIRIKTLSVGMESCFSEVSHPSFNPSLFLCTGNGLTKQLYVLGTCFYEHLYHTDSEILLFLFLLTNVQCII